MSVDISRYFSNNPTSYSLQNNPSWMRISSSGVISGMIVRGTTYNIIVSATNAGGIAHSNGFRFDGNSRVVIGAVFASRINNLNITPAIETISPTIILEARNHFTPLPDFSPTSIRYTIHGGPNWLFINAANGNVMANSKNYAGTTLSGLTISASYNGITATSNPFNIIIASPPPWVPLIQLHNVRPFSSEDLTKYFTSSTTVTYTIRSSYSWMHISSSGILSGAPSYDSGMGLGPNGRVPTYSHIEITNRYGTSSLDVDWFYNWP